MTPINHGKETETQIVWPHHKILWHGEDNSARNSERSKRRERQKKRWEDNTNEWTGMEFGDSLRAAEDRERYCFNVVCGAPTAPMLRE